MHYKELPGMVSDSERFSQLLNQIKKRYGDADRKTIVKTIRADWGEFNRDRLEEILNCEFDGKIPERVIRVNGKTINLYGISPGVGAGQFSGLKPFELSKDMLNQLNAFVRNRDFYLEECFGKLLGVPPYGELKDIKYALDKSDIKISNGEAIALLGLGLFLLPFKPLLYGINLARSSLIKHKSEKFRTEKGINFDRAFLYLTLSSLQSLSQLEKLGHFLDVRHLPEPLEMGLSLYGQEPEKDSKGPFIVSSLRTLLKERSIIERSCWTAGKLSAIKPSNGEVNYIGGLIQLSQIDYFLKNPSATSSDL
jgi:hypothetical protein